MLKQYQRFVIVGALANAVAAASVIAGEHCLCAADVAPGADGRSQIVVSSVADERARSEPTSNESDRRRARCSHGNMPRVPRPARGERDAPSRRQIAATAAALSTLISNSGTLRRARSGTATASRADLVNCEVARKATMQHG